MKRIVTLLTIFTLGCGITFSNTPNWDSIQSIDCSNFAIKTINQYGLTLVHFGYRDYHHFHSFQLARKIACKYAGEIAVYNAEFPTTLYKEESCLYDRCGVDEISVIILFEEANIVYRCSTMDKAFDEKLLYKIIDQYVENQPGYTKK